MHMCICTLNIASVFLPILTDILKWIFKSPVRRGDWLLFSHFVASLYRFALFPCTFTYTSISRYRVTGAFLRKLISRAARGPCWTRSGLWNVVVTARGTAEQCWDPALFPSLLSWSCQVLLCDPELPGWAQYTRCRREAFGLSVIWISWWVATVSYS